MIDVILTSVDLSPHWITSQCLRNLDVGAFYQLCDEGFPAHFEEWRASWSRITSMLDTADKTLLPDARVSRPLIELLALPTELEREQFCERLITERGAAKYSCLEVVVAYLRRIVALPSPSAHDVMGEAVAALEDLGSGGHLLQLLWGDLEEETADRTALDSENHIRTKPLQAMAIALKDPLITAKEFLIMRLALDSLRAEVKST